MKEPALQLVNETDPGRFYNPFNSSAIKKIKSVRIQCKGDLSLIGGPNNLLEVVKRFGRKFPS